MGKQYFIGRCCMLFGVLACFVGELHLRAQTSTNSQATGYTIDQMEGVLIASAGSTNFTSPQLGAHLFVGDRVRIAPNGSLTIRRADQSIYRVREKSEFIVPPPKTPGTPSVGVRLLNGVLYFFHREKPGPFEVETRTASAAVRGTEFSLAIDDAGITTVTVIDGIVDLKNDADTVVVKSGHQGIAEPGRAPFLRAAIDTFNVIQWTLYYPGILDPDELGLNDEEIGALRFSLAAYRAGDLLRAANDYPVNRPSASDAERVYRAGLMLAVGQVEEAQQSLANLGEKSSTTRLAAALQQIVRVVQLKPPSPIADPQLATEWIAESYRLQSERHLEDALRAARNAVGKSPNFGFAWARVAELEFSFGRINAASEAAAKAQQLSPRNAQAIALNGFLLAAQNKMDSAIKEFDRAIAIDARLANAWLGRGLSQIRKGHSSAGREDLLTAAALEPQRAFLRSYLAKAWSDAGEKKLAEHEVNLAKQFDPHDPTGWLYSALLKQQNNRINEAIGDLEHAQNLNTNRSVYRSQFMLDEDRAVRSANLANLYRDAGMTDWSVHEAGRAVAADYANYSAHLFLANSYDQLQDPNRVNLRYETATESEYLIANLLAPVGAGTLSRSISQGEYSKLFERNRFGVVSTTEYLSRGAWYENGAQFGIFGNTAYSLEGIYRTDPGQRFNNDFEERDARIQIKQQLTHKDSVFLRAAWVERSAGDESQYYDPTSANPFIRTRERQEPILTLGYRREWSPGVHTLLLAGRLDHTDWVADPIQKLYFAYPGGEGIIKMEPLFAHQNYRSSLRMYSAEAQQIWQTPQQTVTLGGRFQTGNFRTFSSQSEFGFGDPTGIANGYIEPDTFFQDDPKTRYERLTVYGYDRWQINPSLLLVGGLSYDRIVHPVNYRAAPVSHSISTTDQASPKAGLIWTPLTRTTVRGGYARSLSGASIDQSLTIEPSEIAGFNQSFRSLIPESVVGSDIAARFETFGFSVEQAFETRTYIGAFGEILYSENRRDLGVITIGPPDDAAPGLLRENDNYRERSFTLTADQLLGRDWSTGVKYRMTDSRLDYFWPDRFGPGIQTHGSFRSTLHELDFHANFNHPNGFFGSGQAVWRAQQNSDSALQPGDSFWQVNALVGFRFAQRRAEVAVAILNINDENYHLNPLTPYYELPRARTCMLRLRMAF